jgi:hypothetical protein
MSNVEGMYSAYFIKRCLSEAKPPFDIRYSIFCGSAVRCLNQKSEPVIADSIYNNWEKTL